MTRSKQTKQASKENVKGVQNRTGKTVNMLRRSRKILGSVKNSQTSKYFIGQGKLTDSRSVEKDDHCASSDSVVNIYTVVTPIGDYELRACSHGIHSMEHKSDRVTEQDLKPNLGRRVAVKGGATGAKEEQGIVNDTVQWLQAYFSRCAHKKPLPTVCHLSDISGESPFVPKVWKTLFTKVGFGEKVSYGELAALAGYQPTSARAVGTAMRTNPVSILVPCHRVVKADGSLGNYSGGYKNGLKQWLLNHEATQ